MSTKIKQSKSNILPTLGMLMLSIASIAGFFESPDHQNAAFARTSIVPTQSVLNLEPAFSEESNQIIKEKEEVAPEYVSYTEVQRTAPRASNY